MRLSPTRILTPQAPIRKPPAGCEGATQKLELWVRLDLLSQSLRSMYAQPNPGYSPAKRKTWVAVGAAYGHVDRKSWSALKGSDAATVNPFGRRGGGREPLSARRFQRLFKDWPLTGPP